MKLMLFGLGLLIAGTIGLVGTFNAVFAVGGTSVLLYIYGILSIIGLIFSFMGYSEETKK